MSPNFDNNNIMSQNDEFTKFSPTTPPPPPNEWNNTEVPQTETERFYEMADFLHQGGSYAYYWLKGGTSKTTIWYAVNRPKNVPTRNDVNIYFGVHPTDRLGSTYQRAKIEDKDNEIVPLVRAINCLFAEFDAKHFGNDMEKTLTAIHQIVVPPSIIICSGRGYHCYWYLTETCYITDENRQDIRDIQAGWVAFTGGDMGAKDLARVLRVPGTRNLKPEYGPDFPLVHFVEYHPHIQYTLDELVILSKQKQTTVTDNSSEQISDISDISTLEEEIQYITTHTPHAWLDSYIAHSKKLSPRTFEALHEACGLWLLSATVAGRIYVNFGGRWRHTGLMITAVARSSVFAKSHTIGLALRVLEYAGLRARLLPSKATPQAVIEEMVDDKRVTALRTELEEAKDEETETKIKRKLNMLHDQKGLTWACEGQRAWHLSEFGTKIVAAMKPGSPMQDFSDFLRDMNQEVGVPYVYKTRGHGIEQINNPYLAIIADTTPADLRAHAGINAPLWSNGFFPRFAIIAPLAAEQQAAEQRTPEQRKQTRVARDVQPRNIPVKLTQPLAELNQRLGKRLSYTDSFPLQEIEMSDLVFDAIYKYEDFLYENRMNVEDLDGSLARLFSEQLIAIAALLAVVDKESEILMHHLNRAIECCERIRRGTDHFYKEMTTNNVSEKVLQRGREEQRILDIIARFFKRTAQWPTLSQIKKLTGPSQKRWSSEHVALILLTLENEKVVEVIEEKNRYNTIQIYKLVE